MTPHAPAPAARPPSISLWLRETIALAELGGYIMTIPCWHRAPRGDGHPVLVLPELGQSDLATSLLRAFLARQGYVVQLVNLIRAGDCK